MALPAMLFQSAASPGPGKGCLPGPRRRRSAAIAALGWLFVFPLRVLAANLTLQQSQVGNVFLSTEAVTFPVKVVADQLSWNVTDFWGESVAAGTTPVAGGSATIIPPMGGRTGYFLLSVDASLHGATVATGRTSFAVVTPFTPPAESPFGVMTHYAQGWSRATIPLIARLGASSARDECYWSVEQPSPNPPGAFVFGAPYDPYLAAFRTDGIDPLMELNGGGVSGNPNYDQGLTPYTRSGFDGFANYCYQVVNHYAGQIHDVEIWNEYNGTWCKGPATKDRAATYLQMLEAAYERIKASYPAVTVVGGATAGVPLPYLQQLFQAGALSYMDALSVHPYRYLLPPEGIGDDIARVQALMRQYDGGSPRPIWVTEFGWYTNPHPWPGQIAITEADQAKFLVRGYALLLAAGVARAYWYELVDSGSDPPMGLLRSANDPLGPFTPKPAFAAMATLARELAGATYVRTESTLDGVYSLRFDRQGRDLRLMWSVNPGGNTLAVSTSGDLTVTDLMGSSSTLAPSGGQVSLTLTDSPVYVLGAIQSLPPADATVLADSVKQFSGTQGQDDWYYGYFQSGASPGSYSSGGFKEMATYTSDEWNYRWNGPTSWLNIMSGQLEPGATDGAQYWAVRRWVSPVSGSVRLSGRFDASSNQGDGVDARIFVDGAPVFTQPLNSATKLGTPFDLKINVHSGSDVDFAVDPGPATNDSYDATYFNVVITQTAPGGNTAGTGVAMPTTAPGGGGSSGGAYSGVAAAGLVVLLALRLLGFAKREGRPGTSA